MIKIEWDEVESIKKHLLSTGLTDSYEMMVLIFYHNKLDCDRIQIRLENLQSALFEVSANSNIKAIFVYDLAIKKPFFQCQEPERVSALENVSNAGHPHVLMEFNDMTPEARKVWLEIALAQQQFYID